MQRIQDATARKLGLRVYRGPARKLSPREAFLQYEQDTGHNLRKQLRKALRNYPDADGKVRIRKFVPVPRPDYELKFGGPYTHILHAYYAPQWGCVFGVRSDGELVLWMD